MFKSFVFQFWPFCTFDLMDYLNVCSQVSTLDVVCAFLFNPNLKEIALEGSSSKVSNLVVEGFVCVDNLL